MGQLVRTRGFGNLGPCRMKLNFFYRTGGIAAIGSPRILSGLQRSSISACVVWAELSGAGFEPNPANECPAVVPRLQ